MSKPFSEAQDTLRSFYDSASVMMGTVELNTDDILHISDNRAAATFFDITPEAMQGKTARAMGVPEEYVQLWLRAYRASVTSSEPIRFDYDHVGKVWLKVTVNYIGLSGGCQRFLYVVDDISDLKASERALQKAHDRLDAQVSERTAELKAANYRLRHAAYYDALTGLPNRLLFTNRLTHALERYQQGSALDFAVLFMDLDHFKVINDSLGHPAGDALLVAVGERLAGCMREADTVARFGGDEFAILLEHCDAVRATEVATRMQTVLTQPFRIKERVFTLSASVGLLLSESGHARAQDVLRDADLAMYYAKAHRSGRYEVFDSSMREGAVRRLELEADLRVALQEQALSLHFQPIVRLDDGHLMGFEALVRWNHPKNGFLTPDAFISLAEETGLIIELDRYVLREACGQLARWRAEFPRTELNMNVNLSSQQFMHEGLVQEVEGALLQHGLSPRNLNLEITESLLMHPIASVDVVVEQLLALGVGLCLDDFGTGYSSLGYLRRFPARVLKIDRGFVQDIDVDEKGAHLVEAVVMMAHKLDMRAVAEGVETEVQLARLRELGCEYGQGYLFAKPLTTEQAGLLLAGTPDVKDIDGA
ncbi:MAG: diguanylate cyclase/phosphodiesterase (GGDEF & EAL domains) with PAS/PAC sensor(s) [uncultured Chloroflexia bacterium]|uniref:Diguanylate cyclase/phosphodiesterase (GGDEF & EAL domains) with PAS/PAC sensor(S) n=1 Tax=uncultured Chloroflexia bacterium TaxID=1672391 RepID=A0A6J4L8V6_9CHLR|nr:MAG: diguanylate cyclase/phosphodiesterase (GGDEF & EAL domains) with PAS/PAC sensor(s) [uncultured Chloroflexia bacterium]